MGIPTPIPTPRAILSVLVRPVEESSSESVDVDVEVADADGVAVAVGSLPSSSDREMLKNVDVKPPSTAPRFAQKKNSAEKPRFAP